MTTGAPSRAQYGVHERGALRDLKGRLKGHFKGRFKGRLSGSRGPLEGTLRGALRDLVLLSRWELISHTWEDGIGPTMWCQQMPIDTIAA